MKSALVGGVLFLAWGSMVSAAAMLGLLAIAAGIWNALGSDAIDLDRIQMRSLLKGFALGIGFTAAFAHRRHLTLEGVKAVLRRPVIAVCFLVLALGGYAAWDFLRCDLWLYMPYYEGFVEREWNRAEDEVEPWKMPQDEAVRAMANEMEGREWNANGWRFRLSVSRADPQPKDAWKGTWYVVGPADRFVPAPHGTKPDSYDAGRIPITVVVQPQSLGARISALQFSEADELMLFPEWPFDVVIRKRLPV